MQVLGVSSKFMTAPHVRGYHRGSSSQSTLDPQDAPLVLAGLGAWIGMRALCGGHRRGHTHRNVIRHLATRRPQGLKPLSFAGFSARPPRLRSGQDTPRSDKDYLGDGF